MSHLKEKTTKPKLFGTDSHMENCGGSESALNAFLLITKTNKKIFPDQVTKSPWSLLTKKPHIHLYASISYYTEKQQLQAGANKPLSRARGIPFFPNVTVT